MTDQRSNGGEIDTSAPFESVKEAVSRFGGLGFWKPHHHNLKPSHNDSLQMQDVEEAEFDIAQVEEQAAKLEKELILKEKDTLEVLKELEATKTLVEQLKSKLQREESDLVVENNPTLVKGEEEKENNPSLSLQNVEESSNLVASQAPGLILMELKQAKLNLTRTTSDLAEIRASVESYNKKVERERISLERTRERLRSNSSKISSLEEEIAQARSKLEGKCNDDVSAEEELQRLSAEAEKYKKMGEVAKSEVMKVMLEIEQTKAKAKTAEIRLIAARKMKEAAKAAEAVALAEIDALQNPDEKVVLTLEEYSALRSKAQEANENSDRKVLEAMAEVDEANVSKEEIVKRVEETMEEVETSRRALEEALERVEAANRAKLAVEEALRKWRSEHGEKRRSITIQNTNTKFKNPYPRRDKMQMLDLNGIDLVSSDVVPSPPVLKPTLSIGQILSRKLLVTEEFEAGKSKGKRKVSLGQMLGKQNGNMSSAWKMERDDRGSNKKLPVKRKKFGLARFSVLLANQSKKKKSSPSARLKFLSTGCKGDLQEVGQLAVLKK